MARRARSGRNVARRPVRDQRRATEFNPARRVTPVGGSLFERAQARRKAEAAITAPSSPNLVAKKPQAKPKAAFTARRDENRDERQLDNCKRRPSSGRARGGSTGRPFVPWCS